jgi:hypothetical protein
MSRHHPNDLSAKNSHHLLPLYTSQRNGMKHVFMDNTRLKAIHNLITLKPIFFTHIHKAFALQSAPLTTRYPKKVGDLMDWLYNKQANNMPTTAVYYRETLYQHDALIFIYHTDFNQNYPLNV